ncbi:MAG: HAD family phosphatase, partial [Desulfobacteraceae bacterium]|nr:HAD family phosphatase [Desulfobacteraceae bacterium]
GLQAEAIIFDFDGVIVDTEPLHYEAFQRLLEPLGLGFSWEKYMETYMGFDDRDAFIEAFNDLDRGITPLALQDLIERKAVIFQEIIRGGISAYPGAVKLIRQIHNCRTPLAICSGALRSDIEPVLETLGIADCFEVIVTADDVAKSKPDPECYRLAHSRLNMFHSSNLAAQRVLAIEDTPAGIRAALGAGLQVLAVTNSYPAEQLSQATAITESLDLPEIKHITL